MMLDTIIYHGYVLQWMHDIHSTLRELALCGVRTEHLGGKEKPSKGCSITHVRATEKKIVRHASPSARETAE
jgi:hypothetical protein